MNINMKRYLSVLLVLSVLLNMVVPLSYASTNPDIQMNTAESNENTSSEGVTSTTEIEGEGSIDSKLPLGERKQENEEELEAENEIVALSILPDEIQMGVDDSVVLLVKALWADKVVEDVTQSVTWEIEHKELIRIEEGKVIAQAPGKTTLTATYKDKVTNVNVEVVDASSEEPAVDELTDESQTDEIEEEIPKLMSRVAGETFELTISEGETYVFENSNPKSSSSLKADTSRSDGRTYDYAAYNAEGEGVAHDLDSIATSRSIPLDGRLVVTVTGFPVTFTGDVEKTTYYSASEPALFKKTLSKDETFIAVNTSSQSESIQYTGGTKKKFSYHIFNNDGSIYKQAVDTSTVSYSVPAGGKFVATSTSDDPVTFGGYYDIFKEEDTSDGTVISHKLNQGESYRFVNNSEKTLRLDTDAAYSTDTRFDFAIYKSDGTVHSQAANSYARSNAVSAGGEIVVTVKSSTPITFQVYDPIFVGTPSVDPALWERTVTKNETVSVRNTSSFDLKALTDAGPNKVFTYQVTSRDGSIVSQQDNSSLRSIPVPAGATLTATVTKDNPVTFHGYFDHFKEEQVEDLLFKQEVKQGESYIFTNVSGKIQEIETNASSSKGNRFEYTVYNSDGTGNSYALDTTLRSKYIPVGGKMVVTVTSSIPVTFQGFEKGVKRSPSANPALFKHQVFNSETVSFLNTSTKELKIETNASSRNKYSYQIASNTGSVVKQQNDATATSLEIPAGGKLTVTISSDQSVTFYGYYDLFKEDGSSSIRFKLQLNQGESYVFTNTSTSKYQNLDTDAYSSQDKKYDYTLYYQGAPTRQSASDNGRQISMPPGSRVVVTVISLKPVTFQGFKDGLEARVSPTPALFKRTAVKNETIGIRNTSQDTVQVLTDAAYNKNQFTYQVMKSDGSIAMEANDTSQLQVSVPPGGKLTATVTTELPVTFAGYYDILKEESAVSLTFNQQVQQGQSYVFVNKSAVTREIKTNVTYESGNKFDYAMYEVDGTSHSLERDFSKDLLEIPAGGKVVVTVTSASPVTFSGFESTIARSESLQPALLKRTLLKNESVSILNQSKKSSKIKTTATRYDTYRFEVKSPDGKITDIDKKSTSKSEAIRAGHTFTATVINDNPITFYGAYEHFVVTSDPVPIIENVAVNTFVDVTKNTKEVIYQFTTEKEGLHRLFTSPYQENGGEVDTVLTLYSDSAMQNVIVQNDDHDGPFGSLFSMVEAKLAPNTTYYVKLTAKANANLLTRMTVESDFDSSRETVTVAEWDGIYSDRLSSPYDVDYFKLTLDEIADMNLYVDNNILTLEDKDGNELQTFYANQEDVLFIPGDIGVFYAKVWKQNPRKEKRAALRSLQTAPTPIYHTKFHKVVRDTGYMAIDPALNIVGTISWKYYEDHQETVITVVPKDNPTHVVYLETRRFLAKNVKHTFTWDGSINMPTTQPTLKNGTYIVKIRAKDVAERYTIDSWFRLVSAKDTETLNIDELVKTYNQEVSTEDIKTMQRTLKNMKMYHGKQTGSYDKDLLMSVIMYEVVTNRWSGLVAQQEIDAKNKGTYYEPITERGKITKRLVSNSIKDEHRDFSGGRIEFMLQGDAIIFSLAGGAATRVMRVGSTITVKVSKTIKELIDEINDVYDCNCFTAGTKVLTDEGEKPIEEIEVGDKVLSKDEETGEVAYKEVVGLFQKQADEIYKIYIGDEIIEATAEHPIWLNGKGWTLVKDLKVNDLLVSSDGNTLAIDKIENEKREATVYNFEVANFHSYFVSNLGIWVHNCAINRVTRLLEKMPEFTGSTREKLLSAVENIELRNIVNELYRPGATEGDGGTAYILTKEFYEGSSKHLQKAKDRVKQLNELGKSGKLGLNDLDILDALTDDLEDAIRLFK
ncbi:hypothetical protein HPY28_00390 [Brevibacillus sp. HB1.2]|uniref:polymorphic toxin-type HINT domain-containing protein n=1 Tax=Brevibacillus sp. HB1.2 TaxID=2738807 RepID=UPI001576E0E5|nr:hypothetical protein [Brevibacillus sp. HB1.2]